MTPLLLALALGSGAADFEAAFPKASVVRAASGSHLASASGFVAAGLGASPGRAARVFLATHGAAFGIVPHHELRVRSAPAAGVAGAVRFERRIAGLPLFGGDVIVGVDEHAAVVLVNATDVPARTTGKRRVSRRAAVAAAAASVGGKVEGPARAARGWRASGDAVRPVWRVELATRDPSGEWRSDVDAETGKVLFRSSLRSDAGVRSSPRLE